jgi:hypothetical protein
MHRSGKLVAVAGLLLGLAACGPLGSPPRTTVNVIGDKFSREIELQGIPLHDPTNGIDLFWEIRSFVNTQMRTATHQIYVEWTYTGQSSGHYHAADDTARPLPVQNIYKESCAFNKCPRTDTIGIAIDEATLRRRAATGFQVKLSAQDGSSGILDITRQMINAQLQAEDRIVNPPAGMSPQAAAASANARTPDGKPFLGVAPMDLPFGVGVMLQRVDRNTPGEAAGLKEGDMVLSYDGHPIDKAKQLTDQILLTRPGSLVPIEIKRGADKMTLSAQM